MKFFFAAAMLLNMVNAVLPPLDWRNYLAVFAVALMAFFLGAEIGEERHSR